MTFRPAAITIGVSILVTGLPTWAPIKSQQAVAAPVFLTVRIPEVRLIEGTETGREELYSRVQIDRSGYQASRIVKGVRDGQTIRPNWSFPSTLFPQTRRSYSVPIDIQLWDDDHPLKDEQIDINPARGRTLSLSYNLQTQLPSRSSPSTGNRPGDRATLHFRITSSPFRYAPAVSGQPLFLGGNLWQYSYTLTNPLASTFSVNNWTIPGVGTFGLALSPGQQFEVPAFRSTRPPAFANSTITYADLGGTQRIRQVQVPRTINEPVSMALLFIGLAGVAVVRRRRQMLRAG